MQTKLIDSLWLDAYARQRRTARHQRQCPASMTLESPAYAACMLGVDAGQSSVDARMQAARRRAC